MNNLLQFLARFSNFFLFLGLEIVCVVLIVLNHEYQKSAVLSSCNAVSASIYAASNTVTSYFGLRTANQILADENVALRNQILALENQIELLYEKSDSVSDYIYADKHITYVSARVIHSSTAHQHNYLTINKGRRDGVLPDMGVRNEAGVVGIVCASSERFALVIPLIHTNMAVSSKFKTNNYAGIVQWDGRNVWQGGMLDVARHVEVAVGDTIVTSGLSAIFPADIPVGIVENTTITDNDAFHKIDVTFAVDFKKLNYVQVIQNHNQAEQVALQDSVKIQ